MIRCWDRKPKVIFPGQRSVSFSFAGLYDPDAEYDGALSSQLGLTNRPAAFANSTAPGSLGYFWNALQAEYTPFQNSVGELAGFSAGGVSAKGTSAPSNLIRGQVAFWSENFSTSGNGTALNLGSASSSQRVLWGSDGFECALYRRKCFTGD